jgi:hypothetical protein
MTLDQIVNPLRSFLEVARLAVVESSASDVFVLHRLPGHVIDEHHRLLQASHHFPQHLPCRVHHSFEKSAIAVRMAGTAAIPRHSAILQFDQDPMALGACVGSDVTHLHDSLLQHAPFRGDRDLDLRALRDNTGALAAKAASPVILAVRRRTLPLPSHK